MSYNFLKLFIKNIFQLSFDLWSKSFRYEYHPDLNISKEHAYEFPTEISVPELQYPNRSYSVVTSDTVQWQLAAYNPNIIQIIHDPYIMHKDELVFVEVTSTA